MATLPLDIIDMIYLANPHKIISNYLAFSKEYETADRNNNKRRKISNSNMKEMKEMKEMKKYNNTIKYLLNKDTYMKYYRQSSWLKYFIPSPPHPHPHPPTHPPRKQNKTNKGRVGYQAKAKAKVKDNSVIEPIKLIATYFNQLETNYKKQQCMSDAEDDTFDLITRFETILDTSEFSNETYAKQLEAIEKYYIFTYEIPAFVKLVLILYNCGYFKNSNGISKPSIHIFLEMVLEGDSSKIEDFTKTYKYYSARHKFIPLFGIYLGMGYSFVIGWDTEFDSLIGFTENGSNGYEVMYNAQRTSRYFSESRPARLLKIDKKQLLEDYLKMIGIADISILLDYSRSLDICNMPGSNF
jgi:hypothetical protein